MHLESKFTMSLVFAFFFWGGGVLCHLVVQIDFEFKISGLLAPTPSLDSLRIQPLSKRAVSIH